MHAMTTTELFLAAILVIFAAPWAVWRIARTDSYAPLVVVQIVGGILLGPGVLGTAFPEAHGAVFNPQVIGALNGIAWWAVMMFVFVAGIELDLRAAWADRRATGLTAGLALVAPLLLGAAAALLLVRTPGWRGPAGAEWQVVLGIGMACAVTALPILILLMDKLQVFRTPFGQRVLRYASADDIAIWGVLALILLDWNRMVRQLGFIVLFAPAAIAARRVLAGASPRDRWPLSLVWSRPAKHRD